MSEVKSFAQLKQIGANQQTTISQQNEILANQHKDLQMKQQALEMERMSFDQAKYADIKHNFLQSCDFAIRTLPFWNRSPKAIVNRATKLMFEIKRETGKHIAMEVMASQSAKPIEQLKAETEATLDAVIDNESQLK